MSKCYICDEDLNNNNSSLEHIILNGLGGQLKSKDILCEKHNNLYSTYDDELCSDLSFFTNLLAPKRDRKDNPSIKLQGEDNHTITRKANGDFYSKPEVKVKKINGKREITINAFYSDTEGGQKIIQEYIKRIMVSATKNSKIKSEDMENAFKKMHTYIEQNSEIQSTQKYSTRIEFNKKGNIFISILKMVLGFYFYKNHDKRYVEEILDAYKASDSAQKKNYINENSKYYYPTTFYKEDSIYHTMVIIGNSKNKVLYALVSIYGVLNTITVLNMDYEGPDIIDSYCYDLRNNKEVNFDIKSSLTKEEIKNILNNPYDINKIEKSINNFLDFFVTNDIDINNLANSIEKFFESSCQSEEIFSKRKYKELFYKEIKDLCKGKDEHQQLTDDMLEDVSKLTYKVFNYDKYISIKGFAYLENKIIYSIENIILNNNKSLKNEKRFFRTLKNEVLMQKRTSHEIDQYIKKNEIT